MGRLRSAAGWAYYRSGRRLECPVCERRFRAFRSFGGTRRRNAVCPGCGAFERHRLLWLYLRDHERLGMTPLRLLHIAPEQCLERVIRRLPGLDCVSADLEREDVDVRADMTELPFADGSFDAAICSHVLEHVPDDRQAMRELRRVLRPGGWAIAMTPVDYLAPETVEETAARDPGELLRRFGQADHVRIYGPDVEARLAGAGFAVDAIDYAAELGGEAVARFWLVETPAVPVPDPTRDIRSIIYRCTPGPDAIQMVDV